MTQIQPESKRLQLTYPNAADHSRMKWLLRGIVGCVLLAMVVRGFHILAKRAWCYPMLLVEALLIFMGNLTVIFGNLRTLMHLDATLPIVRSSYSHSRLSKTD